MRRVSETIARAFAEGRPASSGNTTTDGSVVLLHGNRIAWRSDGVIWASLCGWPTPTTRERINAVSLACRRAETGQEWPAGCKAVYQERGEQWLSGGVALSTTSPFVLCPDPLTVKSNGNPADTRGV